MATAASTPTMIMTTISSIRVMPSCRGMRFMMTSVHSGLAPEGADRRQVDAHAAVLETDQALRGRPAFGTNAVFGIFGAREQPDHFRRDAALGQLGVAIVGRVRRIRRVLA